MRVLSKGDVEKLDLKHDDLIRALSDAFLSLRDGSIAARPKSSIIQPDGAFYITAVACWPANGIGIFHSIMGTAPTNVPIGEPHYSTQQLVSDYKTATAIALVDGTFTSTILPACITALTARRLARPDSRIATFIGAGAQARANLQILLSDFQLQEVRIFSRTSRSAEGFADYVRAAGIRPNIVTHPKSAIEGSDIIVTSVPGGPDSTAFLNAEWVSTGAFVSAVDVGRSWIGGFEQFDRIVTDDREQAIIQHREGRMAYGGKFDTEIPELLAGARPNRSSSAERIVVIHPGTVVGVLAITHCILKCANIVS